MYQCNYCPETRPSKSRLATHEFHAHRDPDDTSAEPLAHPDSARFATVDLTHVANDLADAKTELTELKRSVDDVASRMQALDDAAVSPEAVRRSVLNEVLERLHAADELRGYLVVRKMLKEGV